MTSSRLSLALYLTLVLMLLLASNAQGQNCIRVIQKPVSVGQVLVGGYIDSAFHIEVMRTGGAEVEIVSGGDSSVTFDRVFPVHFDSGLTRIGFRYRSELPGQQEFTFLVRDTSKGQSCVDTLRVIATGIDTTAFGTVFPISSPNNVFAVRSDREADTFRVFIINNTNGERVIESFNIDDGAFDIEDVPVVPLILDPGSTFNFEIYFQPPGPGFYQSVVRLPTVGGLATEYTIKVQGLSEIPLSLPAVRAVSGITVRRSATELLISDIPYDLGSVEIFDLLGRVLLQQEHHTREITLDRHGQNAQLVDGAYILRFTSADGSKSEIVKVMLASY